MMTAVENGGTVPHILNLEITRRLVVICVLQSLTVLVNRRVPWPVWKWCRRENNKQSLVLSTKRIVHFIGKQLAQLCVWQKTSKTNRSGKE
jgi:hypothetical protein